MENCLFIKGNIPSSKNSKINTTKGSFMSKTVKNFLNSYGIQKYSVRDKTVTGYVRRPNLFLEYKNPFMELIKDKEYPLKVGFHFIRGTRHKADFHNLCQIVADLFVAHDFILDDSMDYFLPFPLEIDGKWFSYDKEIPGVIIKIL